MMRLSKARTLDVVSDHLAQLEVDDNTGKINWASRACETLFGYKRPGELEGKPIEILVPDSLREKHAKVHRPDFRKAPEPRMMGRRLPDGTKLELNGQRKDGTTFPVEVWLASAAEDGYEATIVIVWDMTGRV